jgi:hypothetical protein
MPVSPVYMRVLDVELRTTLEGFALLLDETASPRTSAGREPLDAERSRALLDALKPLLDSGNPECLKLIGELRAMPGSETLIRQMEDFDFAPASVTLAELQGKRV